jgi:hypothetical protein
MSAEAKSDELKAIARKILECAPIIAQYPFLLDRIESNTLEEIDDLIILYR